MDYDASSAFLIVDVQNDFADPAGSLYVRGGEEVPAIVNGEADRARTGGALVVYTQDWHPASTPHFKEDGGIWPVHCVANTWGAAFHPRLVVDGEIVHKGTGGEDGYSAFSIRDPVTGDGASTGLSDLLRSRGIDDVVIAGIATDYCVKESVLDALREGFEVTLLAVAIRAVDLSPGDGTRAIAAMAAAGARVT